MDESILNDFEPLWEAGGDLAGALEALLVSSGEVLDLGRLRELTGLGEGSLTDWRLRNRYEIWPQWRARYAPDVTHNVEHVFGFLVPQICVATLDPAEHTAQLWLPWRQAMDKVFSPTNRDALWQLQKRVAA